jgi:hypothetical protein
MIHGMLEQLDQSVPILSVNEQISGDWYVKEGTKLVFGGGTGIEPITGPGDSSISWNTVTSLIEIVSTTDIKLQSGANYLLISNTELAPSSVDYNLGNTSTAFSNLYVKNITTGDSVNTGTITGAWNLTSGSVFTPATDLSNNLGTTTLRFNKVYTENLSTGAMLNTGTITGAWSLAPGATLLPASDLGSNLGNVSTRFSTVFTKAIDAGARLDINSELYVDGNVVPNVNNNYDLGSITQIWKTAFAETVNASTINTTNIVANNATVAAISATTSTFSTLKDNSGTSIIKFDTDGTLSANTNTNISTQRAVKTYVDFTATWLLSQIQALQAQISAIKTVPSGTIFYTAAAAAPTGYLICDGTSKLKSLYPDLFDAIGYTYGGSGSSFHVPDLRGQFVRGLDIGRGIDTSRTLGSTQNSSIGAHAHDFYDIYGMEGDVAGNYSIVGGTPTVAPSGSPGANGSGFKDVNGNYALKYFYYNNGSDGDNDGQAWAVKNRTLQTGTNILSETRPTNVALLPIIKT